MTRSFRFDRRFEFDAPVELLWHAIADTSRYPAWFPWLHRYEPVPLQVGSTATFEVRPPLPYRLALRVRLHDVDPCRRVEGQVEGDLSGPARLDLTSTADGSEARLRWEVELTRPSLRRLERVARPAMVWGHDAVVGLGVRRFRRHALR